MTIAYLNSEYPSLSHTFIEREIARVRAVGVDVRTFSVRRPTATGTLGEAHAREAHRTKYILGSARAVVASLTIGVLRRPLGAMRAFVAGQRLSPPGWKAHIWHLAYAIEAIRLAQMLGSEGLRHVHVHMANNGAAIALLATRFDPRLSYSLSIHGSAEFFHVDDWRLKPKAENAVFVRCISEFCRSQVMACTDTTSWDRFHIVRCGVDTAKFTPSNSHAVPDSPGPLRLLTVGRMHPIKGYDMLLRALADLVRAGMDVRLTMVGDGPMLAHLQSLADSLDLRDRVEFTGPVAQEALSGYLDQADAMVVSSFMEGVPVVLMEAMACGLAVVATRVGGIPELVEDAKSGLLIDPGSTEALVAAIQAFADDPERRRSMGEAGRRTVVARYDIERTASEMVELFARYVAEASHNVELGTEAGAAKSDAVAPALESRAS